MSKPKRPIKRFNPTKQQLKRVAKIKKLTAELESMVIAFDFPIRYTTCKKCKQGLTKERFLAGDHHCRLGRTPVTDK